jgi:hypothetical protein
MTRNNQTGCMRHPVFRSLFHYYVALKLSAAAVGPICVTWIYDTPAPIVRRYPRVSETNWDPLELLQAGSRRAVLTVPASGSSTSTFAEFMLN